MMKKGKQFISLVAATVLMFAAVGCDGGNDNSGNSGNGGYKDVIERPEIEMPTAATQVVYPEKPAAAPSAPAQGEVPAVSDYVASTADSPYTVTKTGNGAQINYTDVSDWAYVYVPVEKYSSEYGNVKITLNNGENAGERIAVQAVYYEAYDLNYAPVTVYLGELGQGEQYVIAELGEHLITNASYQTVKDETVRSKTIIGFVVFIDSLPSYAPVTDSNGSVEIVGFEFLKDGDPKLEDRYVKPIADIATAEVEGDVTLTKGETLSVLSSGGAGSAYIPMDKYTSDYAAFTLDVSGDAGTEFDVSVRYTLGETTAISAAQRVTLSGGAMTTTYDFSKAFPLEGDDDFTTQLIKNGNVTDIVISSVTAGKTVSVNGVSFIRTAQEERQVSNAWATGSSDVTIDRAATGGNAKLTYSYYTGWYNLTVPVKKGDGVKKLRLTVYAPDGLQHLGIGLSNTSASNSEGQASAGTFILRGSAANFNGAETEVAGTLTADNLKGIVESCTYDEATKTYTLTYDFTNMEADSQGKTFSDYSITSLIFYLNCPCAGDAAKAHVFEDTHSLYFKTIELLAE